MSSTATTVEAPVKPAPVKPPEEWIADRVYRMLATLMDIPETPENLRRPEFVNLFVLRKLFEPWFPPLTGKLTNITNSEAHTIMATFLAKLLEWSQAVSTAERLQVINDERNRLIVKKERELKDADAKVKEQEATLTSLRGRPKFDQADKDRIAALEVQLKDLKKEKGELAIELELEREQLAAVCQTRDEFARLIEEASEAPQISAPQLTGKEPTEDEHKQLMDALELALDQVDAWKARVEAIQAEGESQALKTQEALAASKEQEETLKDLLRSAVEIEATHLATIDARDARVTELEANLTAQLELTRKAEARTTEWRDKHSTLDKALTTQIGLAHTAEAHEQTALEEVSRYRQEAETLRQTVSGLRNGIPDIDVLKKEKHDREGRIAQVESSLMTLNRQATESKSREAAQNAELEQLRQDLGRANADLTTKSDRLATFESNLEAAQQERAQLATKVAELTQRLEEAQRRPAQDPEAASAKRVLDALAEYHASLSKTLAAPAPIVQQPASNATMLATIEAARAARSAKLVRAERRNVKATSRLNGLKVLEERQRNEDDPVKLAAAIANRERMERYRAVEINPVIAELKLNLRTLKELHAAHTLVGSSVPPELLSTTLTGIPPLPEEEAKENEAEGEGESGNLDASEEVAESAPAPEQEQDLATAAFRVMAAAHGLTPVAVFITTLYELIPPQKIAPLTRLLEIALEVNDEWDALGISEVEIQDALRGNPWNGGSDERKKLENLLVFRLNPNTYSRTKNPLPWEVEELLSTNLQESFVAAFEEWEASRK